MSGPRDFDWGDADADIIVPEQPAIACYVNINNAVVLRQADQHGLEDDHWVYFHPQYAVAIAYAILDAAGLTMQISQCTERGYCEVKRPGARIEQMETERPDINWPAAHDAFDAFKAPEDTKNDKGGSKPKDRTAAERQKRYRERKRNARNGEGVTPVTRNAQDRDVLPLRAVTGGTNG